MVSNLLNTNKVDLQKFIPVAMGMAELDPAKRFQIITGQRKLSASASTLTPIQKIDAIKNNLKFNLEAVQTILKEIDELYVTNNNVILDDFRNDLLSIQTILNDNLKIVGGADNYIVNNIQKKFSYAELISASTVSPEVKTRNAQYLVTDFGVTVASATNSMGEGQVIARPHFGLNWHLGGIDKDLPLSHITNKRIWNRLSIAIGVTIGKINEGNFEDFFNNLTPTVGLNCRITQQVRFGAGAMILREKDPNPLIDDSPVELAPYVSLSFDFSLFEQLGKLAGKII